VTGGASLELRPDAAVVRRRGRAYAVSWKQPAELLRPRVDTLTNHAKVDSIVRSAALAHHGDHPTAEDADRAMQLVEARVSTDDAALFARALEAPTPRTKGSVRSGTAEEAPHCGNGLEAEALVDAKAFRRCG
jgi:hypothetical protein